MHIILFIISLLPYLCLPATIWIFTLRPGERPFFRSVIDGALVWSMAIWFFTNILSFINCVNGYPIGTFWLIYSTIAAILIFTRRQYIKKPTLPGGYYIIVYVCVGITLICALAYPSHYWDAMTYHLARIIHWLQNGNLAPYPTNIPRQIGMPPFNSMIMLQSLAPAGYDYFVNLTQWFAYIGCILGAREITIQLGGDKRAQLFSVLFTTTLPAAILTASNAESSAIITFWLLAFIYILHSWRQSPNRGDAIKLGLCLGLAILSKGSAYPIGLPFVLIVAYYCLRYPRQRFLQGCLAALLIIIINVPHLYRTYEAYGSIVGGTERNILYKPTPGTFAVNIVYNFLNHEPLLMKGKMIDFWEGMAKTFNVDENDKDILPWGGIRNGWKRYTVDDAYSQCPVQAILLLILLAAIVFHKFRPPLLYSSAVLASFVIYWLVLTWHPWAGRIHLTLFILAAPLVGMFAASFKKVFWRDCLLFFLCAGAILPLLNSSRAIGKSYYSHYHFLFHPRDELYFNNFNLVRYPYMDAAKYIAAQNPERIGLLLYDDAFEYPLWAILSNKMQKQPFFEHVFPGQEDKWPEYVFVQEKGAGYDPLADPYILKRENGEFVKVFPVERQTENGQ